MCKGDVGRLNVGGGGGGRRRCVAPVAPEAQLPVLAEPLVPARPQRSRSSRPGAAGLARLPVLAHLVVEAALLLDLLSRQSFSAAMARSTP